MASGPFYAPGRYWGRITHQKVGETKKGDAQLILQFLVRGRINPADPEGELLPVAGELERTIFRTINDNTIDWIVQDFDTLGWYGQHWRDFDEGSSAFVSIVGSEHVFRCDHDTYEGTTREKWSVAGDGLVVKPLDDSQAKQLEALFGRHLQVRKKPVANTPVTPKPAPVVPVKPVGELTPNEILAEAGPPEKQQEF
jgi:hypothetical protein